MNAENSYQLVKIRRDIFIRVAEVVASHFPEWRLVWEQDLLGEYLCDYPDYDIQLYLESTALETAGFEIMCDVWEHYATVIAQFQQAFETELAISKKLPAGYTFKLESIWAKTSDVSTKNFKPECDVILSYEGRRHAENSHEG
ncbi:hypothetical protein [Rheinheimera sp. F8]|uniref:hypothetical protein n=1 Tax=Rheinheimera sp. F8 TaxID=1763998 RepID=UPI000744C7D4|nr:hypothetical protein [Rheinheimera sp. F8]ALZ76698.1 hypothetical protein ATY27_13650 [Rheinheimera sp. F8]